VTDAIIKQYLELHSKRVATGVSRQSFTSYTAMLLRMVNLALIVYAGWFFKTDSEFE